MYISDETIDRFIKEDVPYIDLTTLVLGIGGQKGKIQFFTREDAVLCGTEELAIKAVIAGGGFPHRLGLSETILIFKQHLNFLGGIDGLNEILKKVKCKACEKKVIVEVENLEDAIELAKKGVDGLQFDKLPCDALNKNVDIIRDINPSVTILAAGGINENNAEAYAKTGIDAIVTTSVYYAKPIDIGCKIEPF